MFFLPYAYFVVVFCLFILFLFVFVLLFLVAYLFYVSSLLCPFLGTISFAGYLLVRLLLSAFPAFFSERVPGLIWFGSVYLVTTAVFLADQLM